MTFTVDLNCDLGELPGAEGLAVDEQLLAFISSANIACGGHAGDEARIRQTVSAAIKHGVAIGAHPSFEDRAHFGRRAMSLPREEIAALVERQSRLILAAATAAGEQLRHVKPHGALYNLAAVDREVAAGVIDGVLRLDSPVFVVGLANSELIAEARQRKVPCLEEFFADRNYRNDGALVPRNEPHALIHDEVQAAARAIQAVLTGKVRTVEDAELTLQVDTICIHGDTPRAVAIAERLRRKLQQAGVHVSAPVSR